jgi:hypothetical protein
MGEKRYGVSFMLCNNFGKVILLISEFLRHGESLHKRANGFWASCTLKYFIKTCCPLRNGRVTLHKNVEVRTSLVSLAIKIEIKRNDKSRRH